MILMPTITPSCQFENVFSSYFAFKSLNRIFYGTYGMDRLRALIPYGDCPLSHQFCQQVVYAHSD
jgi:hypothetical protein